jgi:hypothetical protein
MLHIYNIYLYEDVMTPPGQDILDINYHVQTKFLFYCELVNQRQLSKTELLNLQIYLFCFAFLVCYHIF